MEEQFAHNGIKIPICDSNRGEKDRVVFYPDELPEDHRLLSDVLRGVFAPFKVWRRCAVEYHKQGLDGQFEQLLAEIVAALDDPDIDQLYQEQDKEEYAEGLIDIYVALAAKALANYSVAKQAPNVLPQVVMEHNKKLIECLKLVDEKQRLNEYTWLIRGFFEILQGDIKRAEDHFKYVHDRAAKSGQAKRKYYFGSLVGMGVVSYAAQKVELALSYFVKAVQANPEASGCSVRTAIALCCFKLEQYDRARQALEKSLAVDPADPRALLLMAMVEQATAKRDRTKRAQCHAAAYEYCSLANLVEPGNPQTLNMLANHHFHSWRELQFGNGGCFVVDDSHLMLPAAAVQELVVPKNLLRLRGNGIAAAVFIIAAVTALPQEAVDGADAAEYVTVEVTPRIPPAFLSSDGTPAPRDNVEVKDLATVERLAHQASLRATLPASMAESNYILGKVAHSLRDANLAFDFYWKALKDAPDMALAAFGAAEVLFSRKEFQASLELFEKVLLQSPDDKDTLAYVMLLKANLRNEVAPFDKLKEVAPGFQHEADLWLLQGQLRQHDPTQHKHALRCFLNAKECLENRARARADGGVIVQPAVLSNISALHHSLGNLPKAMEFGRAALLAVHAENTNSVGEQSAHTPFCSAELEGVFYKWSTEAMAQLLPGADRGHFTLVASETVTDLTSLVAVGDEVLIAGMKHLVEEVVSGSELRCSCPVRLAHTAEGGPVEMKLKRALQNFVDESLTYSFNYARLLEDDGHTKAATEIYVELLKRHPSYMECYLRLSTICADLGKFEEAAVWLSRALAVKDDEAEATLCLGDLYSRSGNLEEAKKCYDKICSANRHDSKAMLSLGNFYFTHHGGAKADSQLKESYKFFFHVLNENNSNAFAANGLGMVSAKKLELDVARETFAKARESNVAMSEDICTNLAHVYMLQHRGAEAERLYQATIRALSKAGRSSVDKLGYLNEYIASIQVKSGRYQEALRSVLRALHLNPTNLRCWYNAAFVGHAQAVAALEGKSSSSAGAVEEARSALLVAKKVFKHLAALQFQGSSRPYERKFAAENYASCQTKVPELEKLLRSARHREAALEQEKKRREADHHALIKSRTEQKEQEAQALENEKLAKQQLAEQKERKLQELREKWTASAVEKAQPKSKAPKAPKEAGEGGKKRRRDQKQRSSEDSGDEGAGEDDEDEALLRALSNKESIDFGSSDEDGEQPAPREVRARAAKPAANVDDLFGDSDEDEGAAAGAGPAAGSRKRLKKGAAGLDSDDEDFGAEEGTGATGVGEGRPRKVQRVVGDDSD